MRAATPATWMPRQLALGKEFSGPNMNGEDYLIQATPRCTSRH